MMRISDISPDILLNERLSAAELADSPMCVSGMKLLIHAHEIKGIQLTKSGGFFRKYVTSAAYEFQWPGHEPEKLFAVNRVLNEQDFFPLAVMHDLLLTARLIRHYKGKAVVTKVGEKVIGDYALLQVILFETFFTKLDLSFYERFPLDYDMADFRHFLGVIQSRLANWVTLADFSNWCLPLEIISEQHFSPLERASFYLAVNAIRPLCWLGLLEYNSDKVLAPIESRRLRKSPLFDRFIKIGIRLPGNMTTH